MQFIIYTHTDFLDIFTIQQDHLLSANISNVTLLSNKVHESYKFPIITYDDTFPYAARLYNCLSTLPKEKYEYFLLIHDNDIVLSHNMDSLICIVNEMKKQNICRTCLTIYKNPNNLTISINNNIQTISNNAFYTYSVGPSIWHLDSLLDILNNNKYSCYRTIETNGEKYMLDNGYASWALEGNSYTSFCKRHFCDFFKFLHITVSGNFIFDTYSEYSAYAKELYEKYKIIRNISHININYPYDYRN